MRISGKKLLFNEGYAGARLTNSALLFGLETRQYMERGLPGIAGVTAMAAFHYARLALEYGYVIVTDEVVVP